MSLEDAKVQRPTGLRIITTNRNLRLMVDFLTRELAAFSNGDKSRETDPPYHCQGFVSWGLGLFTLGALDSSPLVVPSGNDLLVLALSTRYHERVPYYVVTATR
jgi:hypothetical protein